MKNFKLWDTLLGWVAFAIAAATYLLTMEPTASFWDCGEFIASAFKLDVGHPPGAPFFMLMGHFFSLFASDTSQVAMCVNAMSALASAGTILFLFWSITMLAKKLVVSKEGELSLAQQIGILGAGMVGALAYTFSDTFWFSAVEGEVYASSSLFTAAVFWLILKWDEKADEEGSDRWLILIAYLMGLSIGVHLLNLLTIPAIVLVYYFRKYEFSWKGVMIAFAISAALLAVVLYGMIPGSVQVACWFELFFVNVLGLSFNTGVAVYLILLTAAIVWAIYETYVDTNRVRVNIAYTLAVVLLGIPFFGESVLLGLVLIAALVGFLFWKQDIIPARWLNTSAVMMAVMMIGYLSYAVIVIRSSAQTPMDQNSPDNVFSLKYYLNREQYGDRPLLYGPVYNAPVKLDIQGNMCVPVEEIGHAQYAPAPAAEGEKDHYIVTGHKTKYVMNEKFNMLFPRVYSPDQRHIQAYKDWAGIKGTKVTYDYCGQRKTDYKPTFIENLRFFFSYQVNFMYWRYFMWNFAGRQNDLQSHGEVTKGNWISGIDFIDDARLGDQDILPKELRENKGHNVYYMLPLLLGLLGMAYQLMKKQKGLESFSITFLLFFLTGLAIVVYLNQTPFQPRERDYAYAGSFYAFCIWVGLGVLFLIELVNNLLHGKKPSEATESSEPTGAWAVALLISLACLGVPTLMAAQNWDDHDRSDRYAARDFGANYLKSCEKNGVIFCNGDNDTFPLWYNQEVEGVGTDIRACNLSYVQTDWYIDAMRRPYYESEGLPISWQPKDYITGKNDVVWVENRLQSTPLDVRTAWEYIWSNDKRTKRDGESIIPTDKLYIPISKADVARSPYYADRDTNTLAERIDINLKRRLTKSEMMQLDMISTSAWQRPLYYAVTVGNDYYQGMEPYFELTGLAYQITPVKSADGQPRVNTEKMYDNMMHKFKYGNMNQKGIYLDETVTRICRTHRMMFAQLAEALIKEGQHEKAIEVMDYSEEMLPGYNISHDYTSATMASYYYMLGEMEKGDKLMDAVADNAADYLRYGTQVSRGIRNSIQSTLGHQAAVLNYILQTFDRYDREEMLDKYLPLFEQYTTWMR